ncbi:DnaD domain-containing protein [Caenibacillus caldisaponilyticus]|uniref:DnaD domain-containing protein n=1 Tax=Caenibacillus caldisaponilyticus TaxID=1674942 RepID=UPI0009883BF1|nr:DnaD domain-containing protein [Caenibacillus caldisaponilyticus]
MEKQKWMDLVINGTVSIPRLLLEHYRDIGLNEEECMLLIHLHAFQKEGQPFPTPDQLSERMTCTPAQCAEHLRRLVQRGYLEIVQETDRDLYSESYSLNGLWEKLIRHYELSTKTEDALEQEEALYTIFEKEFGRPLSPIECETLGMWLEEDGHSPEIIKAALRESVLSGKLNFRYIDRILFDWKKNGVRTLEQAKAHGEKVRNRYGKAVPKPENNEKKPLKFPMYNWLEN